MSSGRTSCEEGKKRCVAEERESLVRAGEDESEEEWSVGGCWAARVRRRRRSGSPVDIFGRWFWPKVKIRKTARKKDLQNWRSVLTY